MRKSKNDKKKAKNKQAKIWVGRIGAVLFAVATLLFILFYNVEDGADTESQRDKLMYLIGGVSCSVLVAYFIGVENKTSWMSWAG